MSLCFPALVYFVLSSLGFFSSLIAHNLQGSSIIVSFLFILLWTWFLNYLCLKNMEGISWFLVLFPFIFVLLMFVISIETQLFSSKNNNAQSSSNSKLQYNHLFNNNMHRF